jgi:hypothetical protein
MSKNVQKMSLEISEILDQFRGVSDQIWKQDKKYQKILQSTWDDSTNFFRILNIDWKLNDKYNWILAIILKEKDGNAKSIHKELQDNEIEIDYKLVNRTLNHLIRLNLVQESTAGHLKNLDKFIFFYGLTLNGIVYIIMNWTIILIGIKKKGDVLTYLLDNYPTNPIAQSFIYPYFEMDTLRNLPESLSFEILNYLREICKIIISHTRWQQPIQNSLIDGRIPIHVFSWPSPNEDNRSKYESYFERNSLLRDLLMRELGWKWINEAEFIPRFDEDKILIRSKNLDQHTYIKIDREKKIAKLVYGSKKYFFFRLEILKNNSCSVSGKTNLIGKEILEKGLRYQIKRKLLDLIYVIMTKYKGTSSDLYKYVEDDEKFKVAVKDLVKDLNLRD